jgi:hypothetical protein
MRSLGVTNVDVYCACGHQASVGAPSRGRSRRHRPMAALPGSRTVAGGKPGADALITGDMIHSPLQARYPELGMMTDYDSKRAGQSRRELSRRFCDTPSNPLGMRYRSCKSGVVSQVILGKREGCYGKVWVPVLDRNTGNQTTEEVIDVTETVGRGLDRGRAIWFSPGSRYGSGSLCRRSSPRQAVDQHHAVSPFLSPSRRG